MIRVITNVKDSKLVSTTIPNHMEHGYKWAGYARCLMCYVRIAPIVIKMLGHFNVPYLALIRCPNCGSLWRHDKTSNHYA